MAQIQQLPEEQYQQIMQAFSKWAQQKGLDINQLQNDPQTLEQALGQFMQEMQSQQTRAAKHGAKLQYLRSLKNQCPEGEELYYYKKGGSVGCGCKKKEDGGEIAKAQDGAVAKFKNRTKAEQDKINRQSEDDYFNGTADHTKPGTPQKPVQKFKTRSKAEQERINKQSEKDYFAGTADHTKPGVKKVSKKACGSKIKKDCNGAVAKFKAACSGSKIKKNQWGGSLNGIPFSSLFSLLPKNNSNSTQNPFNSKENIESLKKKKMVAKPKIWQAPIYSNTQAQIIKPYIAPGDRKFTPPKTMYIQKGGTIAEAIVPIYGTYKAGQKFFQNPSWSTGTDLALSGLGDLALFSGIGAGAGMALKGARAAKAAAKTASTAKRMYEAEKAKRYYDLGNHTVKEGAVLYGGNAAVKAQK